MVPAPRHLLELPAKDNPVNFIDGKFSSMARSKIASHLNAVFGKALVEGVNGSRSLGITGLARRSPDHGVAVGNTLRRLA